MKISSLSKTSILLVICFAFDKVIAILRQLIIARQFGLSSDLDIFNIANNLPDMLFILISGGAMAMVVIPVLTDVIEKRTTREVWRVFSSILNVAFLVSFGLGMLIWIFADPIVTSEFGIAPGFSHADQLEVIKLMRLNIIATLIFSVSGLFMGALQANRRFFLPAIAPIFYNIGQIIGAVFFAPVGGVRLFGVTIPTMGTGIEGLAHGVILGAVLHLLIQLPGLWSLNFRWYPVIDRGDENFRRMLRIFFPRILTVFFVQLIFIYRDNLASRLPTGAVTALSYGYMFQQLPETLIGTALGTALLPSLSIFIADREFEKFRVAFANSVRLVFALTPGIAVILGVGLGPMIQAALGLDAGETSLLMWTLRGFLVGLTGHCLLEIANRAYYAQQDALTPLVGTILNFLLFIGFGTFLYRPLGAPGISLSDSLAFTVQSILLIVWLRVDGNQRRDVFGNNRLTRMFGEGERSLDCERISVRVALGINTILRVFIGSLLSGLLIVVIFQLNISLFPGHVHGTVFDSLVKSVISMGLALFLYGAFILPELKTLKRL